MAKADLGTKRVCPSCGTRYYDLNRVPILCPKCGTQFEVPPPSRSRAQPVAAPVPAEVEEVETEDAEVISLEEADEEAAGSPAADGEDLDVSDDEAEEDVFLEEEEEEGDDVSGIIGEVDDEER